MTQRLADERGFTLIELLVVVLVVGILAAIALPTLLSQQRKGQDASAKSDARNGMTQVEACFTDRETYTGCTTYPGRPGTTTVTLLDADARYRIEAVSSSGTTFTLERLADGSYERTCSASGAGGCKADGSW